MKPNVFLSYPFINGAVKAYEETGCTITQHNNCLPPQGMEFFDEPEKGFFVNEIECGYSITVQAHSKRMWYIIVKPTH